MTFDPQELEKLERVQDFIVEQVTSMRESMQERKSDLVDARKEILKEMTIIRNMDDVLNHTMLSSEIAQHERQYKQANTRLAQLKNMYKSPYFARIDFREEGESELEEIYLGKHSLFDGTAFHVYDWRAPISSLYYDFGVGKAYFTVSDNSDKKNGANSDFQISGEVILKRQYQIENGKLIYLFDSELTIDDEILKYELSQVSDGGIKTIIHTIQAEQNKAIRSEADRLIVFGPAGSGKTSVGLHRLAFLLYKHRGSLSSAKLRIFSPSPIFASYIDRIIPDLGEEDVLSLDFSTLLHQYRRNIGYTERSADHTPEDYASEDHASEDRSEEAEKLEYYDHFELIEFLQESEQNNSRRRWIAEKFSSAFVDFLENFIRNWRPALDEDIYFNQDLICRKERLIELYRDRTSAGNLASKSSRVIEFVSRAHEEYFADNRKAIRDFFNKLYDDNLSEGLIRHYFEEQKNIVLSDLRRRLMPGAKRLYERALRAWSKENKGLAIKDALQPLRWSKLLYEDVLVLFFIDIINGKIAKDNQVKHILLDEAQDTSYLQHKILQNLYAKDCHFTILADVNQALYPEIHLHKKSDLLNLYPGANLIPLSTSYRSTYEINQFASAILPAVSNAEGLSSESPAAFKRHGEEPQIIDTANPVEATADILMQLPEHFKTVGILLGNTKNAKIFYEELHRLLSQSQELVKHKLTLIAERSDDSFLPGIMIMSVPFAKGLEFDAVICPEYARLDAKHLYLICTRALHQLYLLRCTGV